MNKTMFNTYVIYKPYGMLSQFTKEVPQHSTLADLDASFEKDIYPVGRLDKDSEGLLVLSNDKSLNQQLLNPEHKQPKRYWAQVEGKPSNSDLNPLRKGMQLRIKKKKFMTLPADVTILPDEVERGLPKRVPPIRKRKTVDETWVEIQLVEGKNRQVRKMFAAIQFPVLRLVRVGIGQLQYGEPPMKQMTPGEVKQIDKQLLFNI